MASTRFKYKMALQDALKYAREEGFVIEELEAYSNNSCKIKVSHPGSDKSIVVKVARHGEACGNLVSFLSRTTKQVAQLQLAAQTPAGEEPPAVSSFSVVTTTRKPPEDAPPTVEEQVRQIVETLAMWLDDQYQDGMVQFTRTMLNTQTRKKLGLPAGPSASNLITAALNKLVAVNILRKGTLAAKNSSRVLQAYRLNTFNGTTILDVLDGTVTLDPAPPPDDTVPMRRDPRSVPVVQPAPAPAPAPKSVPKPIKLAPMPPKPTPPPATDMMDALIDTMIKGGHYEMLVRSIVEAKDVATGVRILRRVAELAPQKT